MWPTGNNRKPFNLTQSSTLTWRFRCSSRRSFLNSLLFPQGNLLDHCEDHYESHSFDSHLFIELIENGWLFHLQKHIFTRNFLELLPRTSTINFTTTLQNWHHVKQLQLTSVAGLNLECLFAGYHLLPLCFKFSCQRDMPPISVSKSLGTLRSTTATATATKKVTSKYYVFTHCPFGVVLSRLRRTMVTKYPKKKIDRSGFRIKIENERFTFVCSRYRRNLKFGRFTSLVCGQSTAKRLAKMHAARAARLFFLC